VKKRTSASAFQRLLGRSVIRLLVPFSVGLILSITLVLAAEDDAESHPLAKCVHDAEEVLSDLVSQLAVQFVNEVGWNVFSPSDEDKIKFEKDFKEFIKNHNKCMTKNRISGKLLLADGKEGIVNDFINNGSLIISSTPNKSRVNVEFHESVIARKKAEKNKNKRMDDLHKEIASSKKAKRALSEENKKLKKEFLPNDDKLEGTRVTEIITSDDVNNKQLTKGKNITAKTKSWTSYISSVLFYGFIVFAVGCFVIVLWIRDQFYQNRIYSIRKRLAELKKDIASQQPILDDIKLTVRDTDRQLATLFENAEAKTRSLAPSGSANSFIGHREPAPQRQDPPLTMEDCLREYAEMHRRYDLQDEFLRKWKIVSIKRGERFVGKDAIVELVIDSQSVENAVFWGIQVQPDSLYVLAGRKTLASSSALVASARRSANDTFDGIFEIRPGDVPRMVAHASATRDENPYRAEETYRVVSQGTIEI
jgi:cell division protein FtsL